MSTRALLMLSALMLTAPACQWATQSANGDEHAGEPAATEEHAGEAAGTNEHAGEAAGTDEHAGEAARKFSAEQIKAAIGDHIEAEADKGIFRFEDEKTGKTLELEFVKIHDPVRKITRGKRKGTYFACTDFQVRGEDGKLYDLDFWLRPADGELEVYESRVHKHPVEKDGEWVKEARYTFRGDEVVEIE